MSTWVNTTLCTVTDVQNRVSDLTLPLQISDPTQLTAAIQNKITLAKDWIKLRLQQHFTEIFPTTVEDAIARNNERVRRMQEQYASSFELTGLDTVVPTIEYGMFSSDDFNSYYANFITRSPARPRTYYLMRAPVSGSSGDFAGQADNGDFLVDMDGSELYLNTGTTDVPTWNVFVAENMIDYVTNPDVLLHAATSGTIFAALQDGTLRGNALYNQNMQLLGDATAYWEQLFLKDLKTAVPLVKVDISGDGSLSSYERNASRKTRYIF
jgi:hypothetical protein